ncbi:hypothetical protein GCM10023322_80250 [Rugosimonospora acidiphila]|uniref:histidine kinase n=1 Tax=Rugosimonospora acidiphila TaxID=556531 RepID=A0ABP9SQW0_9ACTN
MGVSAVSPRERGPARLRMMTMTHVRAWPGAAGLALWTLAKLAITALPLFLLWPQYLAGAGTTVLLALPAGRLAATATRRWTAIRGGEEVIAPYLPLPRMEETANGWWWNGYDFHKAKLVALAQRRTRWFFTDPAMWRDLLYLFLDPFVGAVIFLLPIGTLGYAAYLLVRLPDRPLGAAVFTGVAILLLAFAGFRSAVPATSWYRQWVRWSLGQSRRAKLAHSVERLSAQRGEAIDAQAAELRRIERDLHDGAQVRLVSIGMTLDAVESLVRTDPDAALEMLARVRGLAVAALQELRELVHGIHPPILAERGLSGAVQALAYDLPIATTVRVKINGHVPQAVESTVYLVTSELLTNVVKHARARHASVSVVSEGSDLRIDVTDDGVGGADPTRGSGLRGVQRRLAVFDGVLDCDSPLGGPTSVRVLIPDAMPATGLARPSGGSEAQ